MADTNQNLLQLLILNGSYLEREQVGALIKTFYKQERVPLLVDQLAYVIRKHETEIAQLCSSNYSLISKSVKSFNQVKQDLQQLKQTVNMSKSDALAATESLLSARRELDEFRKVDANLKLSIDVMQECVQVTHDWQRVNLLIDTGRYYSALKAMDRLSARVAGMTTQQDQFSRLLLDYVPQLKQMVKQRVLAEQQEWLVSIRQKSRIVGQVAMELVVRKGFTGGILGLSFSDLEDATLTHQEHLPTQLRKSKSQLSIERLLNDTQDVDVCDNKRVQVNFKSLYQCIHIHQVLHSLPQYCQQYEENRRLQANLVLTTPLSLATLEDLQQFEQYLHDIAGFFIVEHRVTTTTQTFRSRTSVEQLWSTAVAQLHSMIEDSLKDCEESSHYLRIKELIICFIRCLEERDYDVQGLVKLLMTFFDAYGAVSSKQAGAVCQQAIMADEGNGLEVKDAEQLQSVKQIYSMTPSQSVFPCTLPFSQSFVTCCKQLHQFLRQFHKFSEGFHQHAAQMDKILRKSVTSIMREHVVGALRDKLALHNIHVSEIVRVILNLDYLLQVTVLIDQQMAEQRATNRRLGGHHILPVTDTAPADTQMQMTVIIQQSFRQLQTVAEERLFEVIHLKINDFLELNEYSVSHSAPQSPPLSPISSTTASQYLVDLCAFLQTIWQTVMQELPMTIRSIMHYDAVDYVCSAMLKLIVDVKPLKDTLVDGQLACDCDYLVKFVGELKDDKLIDTMQELVQTVKLLKRDSYLDQYIKLKQKQYNRVNQKTLLVLLEHYRDGTQWTDSYFQVAKASDQEREWRTARKRQVDGLVKQLKQESVTR